MNKAAQALGRRAKGVPKTITRADARARSERLALARAMRWPKGSSKAVAFILVTACLVTWGLVILSANHAQPALMDHHHHHFMR
jgi:hypothetical protein